MLISTSLLGGCDERVGDYVPASSIARGGFVGDEKAAAEARGRESGLWGFVDHGNLYGGKVREVRVASSEFSQANSTVMVDAIGVRGSGMTEHWRCLVSNNGQVEELSVVQ